MLDKYMVCRYGIEYKVEDNYPDPFSPYGNDLGNLVEWMICSEVEGIQTLLRSWISYRILQYIEKTKGKYEENIDYWDLIESHYDLVRYVMEYSENDEHTVPYEVTAAFIDVIRDYGISESYYSEDKISEAIRDFTKERFIKIYPLVGMDDKYLAVDLMRDRYDWRRVIHDFITDHRREIDEEGITKIKVYMQRSYEKKVERRIIEIDPFINEISDRYTKYRNRIIDNNPEVLHRYPTCDSLNRRFTRCMKKGTYVPIGEW